MTSRFILIKIPYKNIKYKFYTSGFKAIYRYRTGIFNVFLRWLLLLMTVSQAHMPANEGNHYLLAEIGL